MDSSKSQREGKLYELHSWGGHIWCWLMSFTLCYVFVAFMFQVRNPSSVSLRVVTGDSPTLVIVRSTAMCTPVTSRTIVKSGVVISRTRIHPVLGSIWRYVYFTYSRQYHIVVAIFIRVCMYYVSKKNLDRLMFMQSSYVFRFAAIAKFISLVLQFTYFTVEFTNCS